MKSEEIRVESKLDESAENENIFLIIRFITKIVSITKHIKSYKNYKILNIVSKSNCANDNNVVEGRIWF